MKTNSVLVAFTALFIIVFLATIGLRYTLETGISPLGISRNDIVTAKQNLSDLLILGSFLGLSISLLKIVKEPSRNMRIICAIMAMAYFTFNYAQTFLGNQVISNIAVTTIIISTMIVITVTNQES